MAGRKQKKIPEKRTIPLVLYASANELASLVHDKTISYENRIKIGKRKARLAMRRMLNEVFDVDD